MNLIFSELSQEFWVVLFISIIGISISFYQVFGEKKLRPILFSRIVLFIILIGLVLDPRLEFTQSTSHDQKWNVYVDRSLSMTYHANPSSGSYVNGINDFIGKIEQNGVPIQVLGFGVDLDTSWALGDHSINHSSTNLDQVIQHIQSDELNHLGGSILFTDGQINLGTQFDPNNLKTKTPIHVIGVGSESPMVDVAIHSVDVDPMIIKGEDTDVDVTIESHGQINERLNVTLYSQRKLMGSKVVSVSGEGAFEKVKFRITPNQTGEKEYQVQVNALADEINIQNNRQKFQIQVLKDEYKVALITGAPNFNTSIIKDILLENPYYVVDHFINQNNSYSMSLKRFWDTKYDCIIFDNHPVEDHASEWNSYHRVFAKKLISHQSSFAVILGHDTDYNLIEKYLKLMDINVMNAVVELGELSPWTLTGSWDEQFPFHPLGTLQSETDNLPPLLSSVELDSTNGSSLIDFNHRAVNIPLLLLKEKGPLRAMTWTAPDLFSLKVKLIDSDHSQLIHQILNPVFSWLMRTGNGKDYYFRSNKNSYQQGEQVLISGKPITEGALIQEGVMHLYHEGEKINSKPITYHPETKMYQGQFWASKSGKISYKIEFNMDGKVVSLSEGKIQVQESQIELNHVYLNKRLLEQLSHQTGGIFGDWQSRNHLTNIIEPKTIIESRMIKSVLHENVWTFLILIGLLTFEWVFRRRIGLI